MELDVSTLAADSAMQQMNVAKQKAMMNLMRESITPEESALALVQSGTEAIQAQAVTAATYGGRGTTVDAVA